MGKKVVVSTAFVCAAATLAIQERMRSSRQWIERRDILKELEEKSAAALSKLRQMADSVLAEMHAGLASDGDSNLKMLISYAENLPTGTHPCVRRKLRNPLQNSKYVYPLAFASNTLGETSELFDKDDVVQDIEELITLSPEKFLIK